MSKFLTPRAIMLESSAEALGDGNFQRFESLVADLDEQFNQRFRFVASGCGKYEPNAFLSHRWRVKRMRYLGDSHKLYPASRNMLLELFASVLKKE